MREAKISKIFDIKYGNSFELINLTECDKSSVDCVNFVSRTENNNGISAYVKKLLDVEPNPAGTITVAVGGSVLSTFLQVQPYYTGFHVMVLYPKKKMSTVELLFYAYVIRKNRYRYNYGRQANKTLKDIVIPKFIPETWKNIKIKQLSRLDEKPVNLGNFSLDVFRWDVFSIFSIKDLFKITGSKTTPVLELEEYGRGNYPYVTTQATNNGVEGFYNFYTEDGGVLTVDSAVLGYCSYQSYNFSASDHVEKLIPKFMMNKYIAMFLVTIINQEQYRYNYGRKCSQDRMEKGSIKLPSKDGNPDWGFMENYIKSLSYSSNL